ncbi:L-arabinose ABC transporter ATP-binding protein AraG [Celeribacter sp.]|uniref:L-arabinose ABC transporter ATP-binding protein AraG n=1 Tax=Celeribacter sp. TaxID=1890673 RepID=UPI003A8D64A7
MTYLTFTNISKFYPGVRALTDVTFDVRRGAVHGLMGENGAGKSTLIRILSGDAKADTGVVAIDGEEQHYRSARDARDAGVTVIHQELQLVTELTVAENLALGHFPERAGVIDFKHLYSDVGEKLRQVGIDVDPRAKVADLSIGERQMVEIGKAIMVDARIIALDEPTSSLSAHESETLFRLIGRLKAEGRTILYISHRMEEVFRLCDSLTVLRDGQMAAHHQTLDGVTADQVISEMVGREIDDIWGWRPRSIGEAKLDVQGLQGPQLLVPASFQARRGEILGFFGLIGAGRSELMRLVFGADPQTGGTVRIGDRALGARNPKSSIHAGMVLVPEDRKAEGIIQGRSLEENILISSRRHLTRAGVLNRRREAEIADHELKRLKVRTPSRLQDIVNLSGGNQQKVILCRWLSEEGVEVLLIDEPTRGIDVGAKSEIYDILYQLAEEGMAIVVVSSELPEIMGICDRIHVMRNGQISAEVDRADFTEETLLAAAMPEDSAGPADEGVSK